MNENILKQLGKKKAERLKEKWDLIVGIDPDVDQSGVAVYTPCEDVFTMRLSFAELMDALEGWAEQRTLVMIEKGWATTSFFHLSQGDKKEIAAKKGYQVGRNHQTGMLISEMAGYYGVKVEEIPPLRKLWKGHDRKITHRELVEELAKYDIAYDQKTENQDERDAALIATVRARL